MRFDRLAELDYWHISCKYKGEAARLSRVSKHKRTTFNIKKSGGKNYDVPNFCKK